MNLPELPPGLTLDAIRAGVVVALDPGLRYPALAIAVGGVVRAAARVPVPTKLAKLPMGERVRQVSKLVVDVARAASKLGLIVAFCAERPQIYAREKSKGDPNDLLPLAGMVGAVSLALDVPVISPLPREWIGGVSKATSGDPWKTPRGAVLSMYLSAEERACVESSHDALDGAGICLHALGRLVRRFPGAS